MNRLNWIRSRCRVGEKILDVGAASGFTFRGTLMEPHVTSVDLDLYDYPNFTQMDAHHLTFPDDYFDVAVLGDILEHVENPVQVIKEARRVSKRLIITVPDEANWAAPRYASADDLVRFEGVADVKALAEKANPDIVKFHPDGYKHCFHNRFYSEASFRDDLLSAGVNYIPERLQYDGWSWFTVDSPKPGEASLRTLESQFDRSYFSPSQDEAAKGYKSAYMDFPERLKFLEYVKALKPSSVLDAGCAYGFLVKSLNDAGIPSEGFDVSPYVLKMRATDNLRVASVLNLGCYRDKQFDLAISVELLEHIPEDYTDQALRELARVSKRGVHWIAYKEVDDIFKTQDVTHVNIKPYDWWVSKVAEICGPTHSVIRKETDWYNKPVAIPVGGAKKGLNVGCFRNMLLNSDDTAWLNVDILDLSAYAKHFGYNFQMFDSRKLPFPDDSFDYVVASHFLEHLSFDEGAAFLRECSRVLRAGGVIRLAVPDAELLSRQYLAGELSYFDEVNIECGKADTQLGKYAALLLGNHKSVYDWETLKLHLEHSELQPSKVAFNVGSPGLMRQIFDYHPDLSLLVEGASRKEGKIYAGKGDRLKVAVLSTPFLKSPPDHYGGLEAVTANLAAGLAELGQDVTLFAAKGSQPAAGYKVFETIDPVLSFGLDWGKIDWLEMEKAHYLTFKDTLKNYDIVHGHGWWGFEYLAKNDGLARHVCHTHHGGLGWKSKPCDKMNLIAISRFMAEDYARRLNTDVNFVYNGIDAAAYPFKREKGSRLIYMGRFVSFKQPHIAIEVAKKLGLGLDLIGGAYEEPYFTQQIKPLCDGVQIKLHVELPHLEKVKLLRDAKALLFPSKMGEPFGLVYVEAASCGTPTVGLRDGAIPEIVVEGVSGFVRDDVAGMVEAVGRVSEIKPEDCRAVVEQNFTRRIMSERYLKLYRRILSGEAW